MKIRNKRLLTKTIVMAIFMSSTLYTMPITHAAFNNNTLPEYISGTGNVGISHNNNVMNVSQTEQNAVIQWNDFSIGANATVNFKGPEKFNTLNYVNGGNLSQIYGTINADKGNIYIVNPAGVQIGNSAQINVGSLYVSNNLNNDKLKNTFGETTINKLPKSTVSGGELMSLGNINATNVTFDGNRIVLDIDRVKNGQTQLTADKITIKTTQTDFDNKNVVLGYTAYDDTVVNNTKIGYEYTTDKNNSSTPLATLEGVKDTQGIAKTTLTKADGFMWVKDGEQLQAMNTNLSGNYAFRNSIDLNATADNTVTFNSVGDSNNAFTGNLDGLGYEVYGLHINEDDAYTGLFAKTDGATIRNFNLISGSITSKSENAGAVVGNANNTVIENVKNTINVTGTDNVGGIIGTGTKVTLNGVVNAGAIKGNSNVGGLAGSLVGDNGKQSFLTGESYNLGDIKGKDSSSNNIGGLVGSASNSIIGNETGFQMYNHLDVTGGYNVGGIVGNLEDGSTVQNVYNDGTIKATGMTTEDYTFHTANTKDGYSNGSDKTISENTKDGYSNGSDKTISDVAVANVGGIVGNSTNSTINDATNKADVQSNETTKSSDTYYIAGNVGGIVGKAMNTNMKNVTNEESNIRGAHNVGGIAGYFGNTDNIANDIKYTIENAINNGGDIMGTSARDTSGNVITEIVRPQGTSNEIFNVGNIGGIVGYMDGDNVYVTASGNRGTVHSKEIAEANKNNPLNSNMAANVGGIVGKIDRSNNADLNTIEENVENAAVSNSYNSADVLGYTGVGGIAGMMYNGSIAGSYNTGYLRTTRLVAESGGIASLNMGGIVGDTTENTNSSSVLYDVYNKGQIGDDTYTYYGRHIGGVVGRLSGTVEKAYNNGAIYNGYNVVGGIVGWLSAGNVNNVFNTGNITVINQNTATSQVGGIVGAVGNAHGAVTISNAYNLGALRTFKNTNIGTVGNNSIGGILGEVSDGTGGTSKAVTIKDVYTTGNIYAGNIEGIKGTATKDTNAQIGKIFGHSVKITDGGTKYDSVVNVFNAYYIKPASGNGFTAINTNTHENAFEQRDNITNVDYTNRMNFDYTFSNKDDWRIYKGRTTPILNAFMPTSSSYLNSNKNDWSNLGITGVQYGTAYDPLMTFITANNNLNLDFSKLGITNSAGLVVKEHGLILDNFTTSNGAGGYFGGLIYADGALVINGKGKEDIKLAGTSKLYGSSVDINSSGDLTINGLVQATDNDKNSGNINLSANNINVYGTLKTARTGETVTIEGVNSTRGTNIVQGTINDPNQDLTAIESLYAYKVTSNNNGDLTIESNTYEDENKKKQYKGDVNLYYGNLGQGLIDVAGDVNLEGKNVYVDSDMVIGGNLNATADSTGEIIVDISNIGKVSLDKYTDNLYNGLIQAGITGETINAMGDEKIKSIIKTLEFDLSDKELEQFVSYLKEYKNNSNTLTFEEYISDAIIKGRMHNFLHSFYKGTGHAFNFKGTDNAKITVDLWNGSAFDLDKYDIGGHTLSTELSSLNIAINNNTTGLSGRDVTYIWVADGEQLKGVQDVVKAHSDYNFALKNDINATDVSSYQAIGGSGTAFTGKFDGRGNRIIGLNVSSSNSNDNVGVFGVNAGTIKNLKVYSSTFKGYDNVGAIAGTNNGTIDNVTTLGNTVEALGSANSVVGAAGGVVGTNNGAVDNATSRDSVIAGQNSDEVLTTAGGIAGINTGLVSNSQSHSAVIASGKDNTYSLGGIVGVNTAKDNTTDNEITAGLDNVNAYGVTGSSILVDNTGGIAGLNSGTLNDAYNESIVKGLSNVGGIAGTNSGEISLIVNGASVTAEGDYTGGLVGSTTGNISDGRNNGVITGNDYVGGLVGNNGTKDITKITLKNLTNDSSAEIIGNEYVGGIAGSNYGTITAEDQTNLINRGSITGNKYIGGIAGKNNGTITNVNNDIVLNATGSNAQYFGGVTGINKGTITNATNSGNINASGATYVGGITGRNNGTLSGAGNKGEVTGKDYVGGVAGLNTKDITGKDNNNIINIIGIKNEGTVIAEAGGAGGIFGKNEADIQYAELSNSGTVTGTAGTTGTGGIFGENTGDIDHSSLKNEVKGNVSGVNNVGGLIGINSGTIEGGRDEASHYYKYQIYNNGTITATGNGSNIGGLIGYNKKDTTTGSLTAGYNTGNIVASDSTNVGGIVGTNEGTVKEVFNTIMTANGENETIDGRSNVGAIIGDNTKGRLTNAYSTNGATYLVGSDESLTGNYKIDDKGVWKTYKKGISSTKKGKSYDVLKVFLTSVGYGSQKPNFVYNGKDQSVDINEAIANKMFIDLSGKQFDAYENTTKYDKDINLIGSNSHKDVKKTYTDWLYSGQIASSGTGDTFNPNNLGYDIDLATGIEKAQINITLNDIERIYGNLNINSGNYGFTYGIANGQLTEEMKKELLNKLQLGSVDITEDDGALIKNGTKTNNVGEYNWTGTVTLDSTLSSNYELKNDNDGDGSITSTAISKVTPKTLTLNDLLATIVYGNQDNKGLILQKPNNNTDILNGIVYGDDVNINLGNITLDYKNDSAYDKNKGNRVTADVETYEDSLVVGNISLINNENKNYVLDKTTTGGSIQVTPASLTVGLNNVSHEYGSPELNSYGISSIEGLTNGDEASKDKVYVTMTKDTALKDENTHTNNAGGSYTWTGNISGLEGIENNYNITVNNGKSTVDKANLTIDLNDVKHTYGSPNLNDYGVSSVTGLTNGDKANIGVTMTEDTALKDENTHTNNAGGSYTWTGNISGLEGIENNYNITVNNGKSTVDKANLTIDLNDVEHTYGNPNLSDYGVSSVTGLTNGDKANIGVTMTKDNALKDKEHTNDAGDYTWTGSVSGIDGLEKNYNIKVNDGESVVNKAALTIDLNKVYHTYGDPNLGDYGVSNVTGLTNGDKANIGVTMTKDNALKDNNKHTNNAGDYTWTGSVSGIEGLENNYNIKVNDGQSVVNKADLTIDLNENVHHEYGKPNLDDYVITGTDGLTNGDEAFEDKLDVTMTHDDALTDNNTHTKPAGGDYTWTGSVDGIEGLEDNYNITINPGKSTVDKGHLTITVDDSNTTVGDNPNYGGTVDGWANGDNPNDFDINFGLDDDTILDQPGKHDGVIGVIIDGTFYPSGTEDDIFNNYDVTISTGDLTVLKPIDINDYKNWSHLYKDAPWDRNRDFKERKAEFNFVDGGIYMGSDETADVAEM